MNANEASPPKGRPMNGADAMLETLRANNVTAMFTNPGTTEIHVVAALDDVPEIRPVLCLFEGVATGAADGFARIAGRPAATLLHLGPGLANGWANLHNARRARSPIVNIVGDHPDQHRLLDPPLESDIEGLVSPLRGFYRRYSSPDLVSRDTADALQEAAGPPGRIATLTMPSDVAWGDLSSTPSTWSMAKAPQLKNFDDEIIERALRDLGSRRCGIFLGGDAVDRAGLDLAQRLCTTTSATLMMESFPPIFEHGAGIANPERLIYLSDFAALQLQTFETLIVIGTTPPVPPFAYRDGPLTLIGDGCDVIELAPPGTDAHAALEALVNSVKGPAASTNPASLGELVRPTGTLNAQSFAAAVASTITEGLVIVDESITSGLHLYGATMAAAPHRVMSLTGHAIGYGLPAGLGAAVASGERVLVLESDGSMMYTIQSLWTIARESLDITVLALCNNSYAVVDMELHRVHAPSGESASQRLMDLDRPVIDLLGVAKSLGVPGVRVTTADELTLAIERSYRTPGPMFIEVPLPKGFS